MRKSLHILISILILAGGVIIAYAIYPSTNIVYADGTCGEVSGGQATTCDSSCPSGFHQTGSWDGAVDCQSGCLRCEPDAGQSCGDVSGGQATTCAASCPGGYTQTNSWGGSVDCQSGCLRCEPSSNGGGTQLYRCSGANTCIPDNISGNTTASDCNNSCTGNDSNGQTLYRCSGGGGCQVCGPNDNCISGVNSQPSQGACEAPGFCAPIVPPPTPPPAIITNSASCTVTVAAPIHNACSNGSCVQVSGAGSDQCNSSPDCPQPPTSYGVTYSAPNYCTAGPGGFIAWSYSDPANSPQTAYQIQIYMNGDFGSPTYDSGKINSTSKVFSIPNGVLTFNHTYQAHVMSWNTFNLSSAWSTPTGNWTTPVYAYPNVAFTWTPHSPGVGTNVQFTDGTTFGTTSGRQWSWNFGDGNTSTTQNPGHAYSNVGTYTVVETATEAGGYTCSIQYGTATGEGPGGSTPPSGGSGITVQKPIPIIKEVAPK